MSPEALRRDHRRLRLVFLLAVGAQIAALALVTARAREAPWKVQQRRFHELNLAGGGSTNGDFAPAIGQYFTCASEVDRCPSCHLAIERTDMADAGIPLPFRGHGPGLGDHLPDRIGCSACHGGCGRSLDPEAAHALADTGGERDALMCEPHIQASCARCHVPGARAGQERLEQGAWLYLGLGCSVCHPLAEGGRGGLDYGPDLAAIGRKSTACLKTSLFDPAANFSGSTMPSFRLALEKEPEALESLLIFLESLALDRYPDCADREKSRSLVERPCADCHGGKAGQAGGRMRHRCSYLVSRADELRCANCHAAPGASLGSGKAEAQCPLLRQHGEACAVCHDCARKSSWKAGSQR
ncbi:MAG: hypothetical protein AB1640_03210 [bacterium]